MATDVAGNAQTLTTSAINIDKIAPWVGSQEWSANPKSVYESSTLSLVAADTLSGVVRGEYYLGDTDPGQGNAAVMGWDGTSLTTTFGVNLQPGVYQVNVRAQDAAGNWSEPSVDYLVVYDPIGARVTGRQAIVPSYDGGNGDILPGLTSDTQTDKATFGFNVSYNNQGVISSSSDMMFSYTTGTKCNSPTQAENCHNLTLDTDNIEWLVINGKAIFQGTTTVVVDGQTTTNPFRVAVEDNGVEDFFALRIYAPDANPNTDAPLYRVSRPVAQGNIQIL